jgi:hypothetical protein
MHRGLQNKKNAVLVCHRRSGKTVGVVAELVDRSVQCTKKNPQYAYLAPTFAQAKKVAWQYFIDMLKDFPGFEAHQQELRIRFTAPHGNGVVTIYLLGIENANNIRGMYFDGVIADEYQEWSPDVWSLILKPALLDRDGWAIFIGTAKPNTDFKTKYDRAKQNPAWFTFMLKADDSGIFRKEQLDEIREEIGEAAYEQEMNCNFAGTLIGAYFSKYMKDANDDKRVTKVLHDPALVVNTYWDLGINDTTTIWFRQQLGNEYRYIEAYQMSGVGLEHYVKILKDRPYVYGRHVLPHDAAARELGTGVTRQETLRKLGLRCEIQPRQSIEDRIQATRLMIPKSWFDAEKCARGIEALKSYQRKYDPKHQIYSDTPLHDWSSHFSDSFGYSALDSKDQNRNMMNSDLPRTADSDYNELDY